MIHLQPEDYLDPELEWKPEELQKECCRLARARQQQAHLLESLLAQLEEKGRKITELESRIRHLKALGGQIVRAAMPGRKAVMAGSMTEERMERLYFGRQDD